MEKMEDDIIKNDENSIKSNIESKDVKQSNAKKGIVVSCIAIVILAIVGISILLVQKVIVPNLRYQEALSLYNSGNYKDAETIFIELNDFNDSKEMIKKSQYGYAMSFYVDGDYNSARDLFTSLGDFDDSKEMIKKSQYGYAMSFYVDGDYNSASELFTSLGDFDDSKEMAKKSQYAYAVSLYDNEKWDEAYESFDVLGDYMDSIQKKEECYAKNNKPSVKSKIGDIVIFGKYEQDNDKTNGKEPIEWRVLDKTDDKMLLISKYVLDCRCYDESSEIAIWENSSLRRWLNYTFIDDAFDSSEKKLILSSKLENGSKQVCGNAFFFMPRAFSEENDTYDKIFCLSGKEANKYLIESDTPGDGECFGTIATKYAMSKGYEGSSEYRFYDYWLRSPGFGDYDHVSCITNGDLTDRGLAANDKYVGVRPALWISN